MNEKPWKMTGYQCNGILPSSVLKHSASRREIPELRKNHGSKWVIFHCWITKRVLDSRCFWCTPPARPGQYGNAKSRIFLPEMVLADYCAQKLRRFNLWCSFGQFWSILHHDGWLLSYIPIFSSWIPIFSDRTPIGVGWISIFVGWIPFFY